MHAALDTPVADALCDPLAFRIEGWLHGAADHAQIAAVEIRVGGQSVGATRAFAVRPDVNAALALPADTRTGFQIDAHCAAAEFGAPLELELVAVFTDYLIEDRRRGRIMFVESQATPVLMPRANELIGLFTAPIALTIGAGDYTDPVPDEHDSALNASAIFGALAYLYRPWLDDEIPVPRARFDEHAATVLENIARVRSSANSEA